MVHTKKIQNSTDVDYIISLIDNNKFDKALIEIRKANKENKDIIDFLLGYRQLRLGNFNKAISYLESSLSINPLNVGALLALGITYRELKIYNMALDCVEQSLILNPNNTFAKYLLAVCLAGTATRINRLKAQTKLESLYFELIEDSHNINLELIIDVLCSWGAVLLDLECYEKAEMVLLKALAVRPYDALANRNLASVYLHLGRAEEAKKYLEVASINNDADTLYQLGMVELLLGNYPRGWRLHEARLLVPTYKEHDLIKPDKNISIKDLDYYSTVLVYQEQGIGDTLQFSRYINELLKITNNIDILLKPNHYQKLTNYEVPSIKNFIEENFPNIRKVIVRTNNDKIDLSEYDLVTSLMSLPYLFETRENSIPSIPYFKTNTKSTIQLPENTIGLFWSGSNQFLNNNNRSVPHTYINEFIANNKNKTFVSLQLSGLAGLEDHDNVIDVSKHMTDLLETLAILKQCKLVITVDSMIAHLSAGANIPTWILQSKSVDWRWGVDRKDSPWYPSVINFRQNNLGDWIFVLDEVTKNLQKE